MSSPWLDGDEAVLRGLETYEESDTPPCEEELLEAGHTYRARGEQRRAKRFAARYGENRFPNKRSRL